MNDIFTVNRLWLLIRSDFLRNYRSMAITSAALALLIFITSMMAGDVSFGFYNSWFGFLLFLYGVHLSSKAFFALHDKTQNQAYLLVPASSVEKTVTALFRVTIGFVVYLLILVTCVSFITELAKLIFFGERGLGFDPFKPFIWKMIGNYLFLQSFFFLGSAWFSKHPLVKTVLTLCVIALGLLAIYWVTSQLIHDDLMEQMKIAYMHKKQVTSSLDMILPLCCWLIAWLRVKEAQVSQGV